MTGAALFFICFWTYAIGFLFAFHHDFCCLDFDEAILWPIYLIKWFIKAFWKAVTTW